MRHLAVLLLAATAATGSLHAHPFLQNSWWVVAETNRLVMRVSATLREVAVAQGLDPAKAPFPLPTIQNAVSNHAAYVAGHVAIVADGSPLKGEVLDHELIVDSDPAAEVPDAAQYLDRTHAVFDLEFPFPPGRRPREIRLGQATLREHRYAPGVPWDVTYTLTVKDAGRRDIARGVVRTDLPFTVELEGAADAPVASSPPGHAAPPPPEARVGTASAEFASFLRHGLHHVLTGYDHLLFLCALALAAARWRDLFRIVALFTLAHSITVTVSALGWVRLPSWIIEPLISGSIVCVALENVLAPQRAGGRARWFVAFGFGLVHGLGFAGGLRESLADQPTAHLAVVIVAFCAGVELGHLAVGGPLFGILHAVRRVAREDALPRIRRWGSVAVAVGGAYFLWAALRQI